MLKKRDVVYYARIQPTLGVYDVLELTVRMVETDWFSALDKRDKRVYLFNNKDLNNTVFINRKDALNKVKEAGKNKKELKFTIDTE